MDPLSVLGIGLGFFAIVGGNALEGGHFESLINGPAFVIVILGTIGATMFQSSWRTFFRAMEMLPWVFRTPTVDLGAVRSQVVAWAHRSRKEGLLGLESVAEAEKREFYKKGLHLMIDGAEPQTIRAMLETDLTLRENIDLSAARVYESMAGYAPTFGIIGAVMGLMHVMANLQDVNQLAAGIATAFVATLYGLIAANLILLPVSVKLRSIVRQLTLEKELVIDGLVAIAEGENPKLIDSRLDIYTKVPV